MADQETLRPRYKAGYNLHPEIGNILLEVDTDAKTVTPSLEPGSPYTLVLPVHEIPSPKHHKNNDQ